MPFEIIGALARAKQGLRVFPCRDKKPLTRNGFRDASADLHQIEEWWREFPGAQIGVLCGRDGHLVVADLDGPRGMAWAEQQGIPPTREVETSPGRKQLWFRPGDRIVKTSAGVLAPEVDVRGEGSYTIAPPSVHHLTGKPYRFLNQLPLSPPPDWLAASANGDGQRLNGGDAIPQGRRHQTLLKLAGGLRARGLSEGAILADLIIVNQQHCVPPLPQADLERLSRDMGKKPPGFRGERMEAAAEVELERYGSVEREKVRWLWPGRLPEGKLVLLVGNPGTGKSLVSIDVAARISRGDCFPDGGRTDPGDVLIVSAEDSPRDVIAPRLDAARADTNRVARIAAVKVSLSDGSHSQSPFALDRDLSTLEQALRANGRFKLVILDPLSAYLGRVNSWRDSEVRDLLSPLADFAERLRVTIAAIMHLRKSSEGDALARIGGSVAFGAAARLVHGFTEDPETPNLWLMVPMKNNLGPLGDALAYQIVASENGAAAVAWAKGTRTVSADELLGLTGRERRERAQRLADAEEWLRERLVDGSVPQQEVEADAKKAGFSWATIRRAKERLGVKSQKLGLGGWVWQLPEDAQDGH